MTEAKTKWMDRARAAMKAKGITYKDMAAELGLSESAVSHQINGRRGVTLKQIRIYSNMLDMAVSELVGDDAVFISDERQIKAVELLKEIPEEKRDLALKMLATLVDDK